MSLDVDRMVVLFAAAVLAVGDLRAEAHQQAVQPEPIPWSAERPLEWHHYAGQPDMTSKSSARTTYQFSYQEQCRGDAFTFTVLSRFQPAQSWVKPGVLSNFAGRSRLLAHEQGHFDLSEVHARKLRRTLSQIRDACRLARDERMARVTQVTGEDGAAQNRYDWETGYGVNETPQGLWLLDIKRQLAELAAWK